MLWLSAEQSNSSLIVDDAVDAEDLPQGLGRRASGSRDGALSHGARLCSTRRALLGEVVRITNDGERHSLAVAQAFVRNQGDAWSWTLDRFNRALDDLATPEGADEARADDIADYTAIAAAIGKRLGEMHAVLARPSDDPAFAPETAGAQDVEGWTQARGGAARARLRAC